MPRILILALILLNFGVPFRASQAQLLRGSTAPPTAREPARLGLLGGLREAREERFRREDQAATAAARTAAAQRNAAANRAGSAANNGTLRQEPIANANSSLKQAGSNSRTANYGSSNVQTAERIPSAAGSANSKNNTSNELLRPRPVVPSATSILVPAPARYDGPGVTIRLPKDSRSVVNYLVDEVESNAIRPGEQQVLDSKGSYIVRYSRGVTADGRSFGESRYTITEGLYRFELTATGWELYRESDANLAPPNRLDFADSQVNDRRFIEPSSQSELRRAPSTQPLATQPLATQPLAKVNPDLTPSQPVASEEVLPAPKPRSILE